jgi:hypothetical protein
VKIWEEEHEAVYITACPVATAKELYFFRIGILTLCLDWITILGKGKTLQKLFKRRAERCVRHRLFEPTEASYKEMWCGSKGVKGEGWQRSTISD